MEGLYSRLEILGGDSSGMDNMEINLVYGHHNLKELLDMRI